MMVSKWIVFVVSLALLGLFLSGCPDNRLVCPLPLTAGNLTPDDIDNLQCCAALKICCTEVQAEEDKKVCDKTVAEGAIVSCQAEYNSLISFDKCKPVYVRDHPEIAPKTEASMSDAGEQVQEP